MFSGGVGKVRPLAMRCQFMVQPLMPEFAGAPAEPLFVDTGADVDDRTGFGQVMTCRHGEVGNIVQQVCCRKPVRQNRGWARPFFDDRDIDVTPEQEPNGLGRFVLMGFHAQERMVGLQHAHCAWHDGAHGGRECRDGHPPHDVALVRLQCSLCTTNTGNDFGRVFDQQRTRVGEFDTASAPNQQWLPHFRLKFRQLLRQCGTCHVQGLGRRGNRAVLGHGTQGVGSSNIKHQVILTYSVYNIALVLNYLRGDSGGMNAAASSRTTSFATLDWLLFVGVGLVWGASFLLIKLSVAAFPPPTVAWLRLLFGAAILALVPGARAPLRYRRDWWWVALLGLTWMAVPFVLFPIAEQTIDSGLAGMLDSSAPLFTAVIAALWFRNRPTTFTTVGLLVGFAGVVAVTIPSVGGQSGLLGVLLVLLATVLYGVAFCLSEPLEHRNGALPVIWRAMLVALLVSTPTGFIGLTHASPTSGGITAILLLGTVCTGIAFACFVTLVGRVGAARASVSLYLMPVVAIILGAFVASESIHPASLGGIALVLLGAWLVSIRKPEMSRHPVA